MPTLLVVDDEPNVLYSLEKALQSDALDVRTASTARHGLDLVRRLRPDVVLLDVRLADMGGEIYPRAEQTPEALRALQKAEIEKWWPIIKAAGIKGE